MRHFVWKVLIANLRGAETIFYSSTHRRRWPSISVCVRLYVQFNSRVLAEFERLSLSLSILLYIHIYMHTYTHECKRVPRARAKHGVSSRSTVATLAIGLARFEYFLILHFFTLVIKYFTLSFRIFFMFLSHYFYRYLL